MLVVPALDKSHCIPNNLPLILQLIEKGHCMFDLQLFLLGLLLIIAFVTCANKSALQQFQLPLRPKQWLHM